MGPEIVFITLILTVGAVSLLRPITKRLGGLLEAMARENDRRAQRPPVAESSGLREILETMNARLDRLEDRQDFTDALLSGSDAGTPSLPPPRPEEPPTRQ